jgi:ABC-2 type transport system permease protein
MSQVRSCLALYRSHLLAYRRTRTALYWSLAFPMFFLLMFGFVFGHGDPDDTRFVMPGLFTITIISGSVFGIAMRLVTERESGILRRLRVTPVSGAAVVLAHGLTALTLLMASLTLQLIVARLLFHFRIEGSVVAFALVLVLAGAALIPVGLLVGSVARDSRSAPAIANFLFFPLMFLSGAAIPFMLLPEWMQRVARLIPTTYVNEALQGVVVRGEGLAKIAGPVAVLALTAVVGIGLNGLLFRWESTEPVRRDRLMLAVAGLGVLYVGAYFLAPALGMAHFHPKS